MGWNKRKYTERQDKIEECRRACGEVIACWCDCNCNHDWHEYDEEGKYEMCTMCGAFRRYRRKGE